jgi:threonine dehydrogenase-like Zn-dependent dehydrogenase
MGHEFSARVLEAGPGASHLAPGDVVVSIPLLFTPDGPAQVGYSARYPGGYGERMVLGGAFCLKVPVGLDPRLAALTEPMAVGVHAVAKSAIKSGEGAVVIGAGPIGLAITAALRLAGAEPVVVADFSPKRRALALHMGAHAAIDPRKEPPFEAWTRIAGARVPVAFEAVGVKGMLDEIITAAPRSTRVVVAGVCMEPDTIRPLIAIAREVSLHFVLGYDPLEFGRTLNHIAAGEIDVAPLITGEVGISGVPGAFAALADPEAHAKILVMPALG